MTRRDFAGESGPPVSAEETASLAHEDRYAAMLAQDSGNRDALRQLSLLLLRRRAFEEAATLIRRFIEADPDFPDAHHNLGIALQGLDRTSQAAEHFEKAIALAPQRPEAYLNLGRALQKSGHVTQARERFEHAIALRPDYAEAHNSLGVLLAPDFPQEAFTCFQRALAGRPNYADAHGNMGNVLHVLDRHDEAITSYRRALAIKPDHAEAHNNLGMVLRSLNRDDDAVACFETAQAIRPDYVDAQLNEGLSRLALGDYATGWKKYAWRKLTANFSHGKKNPPRPLWLGNWDIAGKTILLHGEQGLGDTIQFARYAPRVAQRGARVILAVQEPLSPLLGDIEGVSVLRAKGEAVPPFDCYCPLPSLPLAFGTTLDTIPADVPYVRPPADRLAKWRPAMESLGRPRIGLMWRGSQHNQLRNRAIPLRILLPLLDLPDLHWVALQKEVPEEDMPLLEGARIATFLGDRQSDLADAAAMIAMLDLVITIDTSIAHLAGAMGKPVWVLLPFSADWRWLRHRDDSPWYPTARLFRQAALGDWTSVARQVENAIGRSAP